MSNNNTSEEIERLKARVGWLDHLDTEEGRRMHANEALLVEIEQLKAELLLAVKLIDHAYCWTGPTDWQMQKEAWDFWRRHKEAT